MFYYIEGRLSLIEPGLAVVDCGGVGYALNTTANTLSRVHTGDTVRLYTCEIVREDCFDLYGFATREEKRSFELLLGVSGVGPKAALGILSSNTPEALSVAILSGNERALTVVPASTARRRSSDCWPRPGTTASPSSVATLNPPKNRTRTDSL